MNTDDEYMSGLSSDGGLEDLGSDASFGDAFDEDEPDLDFPTNDKDLKRQRKAFEVEFKVYGPAEVQKQQDKQIEEVGMLLGQPAESTAILLRYMRWNKEKLIEQYMEEREVILEKAGLGESSMIKTKTEVVTGFSCDICCEDEIGLESYAIRCGHRFCADCYRTYLVGKIKDEGEAALIQCPKEGCNRIVDSKSLDYLIDSGLDSSVKERYHELLTRTYVDDIASLKWCPAPECVYAIECGVKKKDLAVKVPTVYCKCGDAFCFGCGHTDHQPAFCLLVKRWLKKCADDSETANWINAHTKECPKCNSTIEKNGGCNHMTCRKCHHEFCWMCMGIWSEHGTSWYNCNRFSGKAGETGKDDQARSRQSLERYLHYYNRYANHEQSAKLDADLYLKTEKKMQMLQAESGMSWIEVQYIEAASVALQQCRQTLKWTYAFAYYLARNNFTEIFEDNQKDLEMAVENLSEMFERPVSELKELKSDMLNKTVYCQSRRTVLLEETAKSLAKGETPTLKVDDDTTYTDIGEWSFQGDFITPG
ncbi:MAG: hypothetical protein M1814_005739 [Vezdaea aestivalis]|nr:MAG: hypothetical protein M1814_005739 [Vezdaea aestivalis]